MNHDFSSVTARIRVAEGGAGHPPSPIRSMEFKPYLVEILETGSWALFAASGQQILDFSLLPRRNISTVRTRDKAIGLAPAVQGPKRKYEPPQPAGVPKRWNSMNDGGDGGDEGSGVFAVGPSNLGHIGNSQIFERVSDPKNDISLHPRDGATRSRG
ncbi:hypothetical protein VTK26DRAFT_5617 [Humicola hyalothermophila]